MWRSSPCVNRIRSPRQVVAGKLKARSPAATAPQRSAPPCRRRPLACALKYSREYLPPVRMCLGIFPSNSIISAMWSSSRE